jgi:hypothetical protein
MFALVQLKGLPLRIVSAGSAIRQFDCLPGIDKTARRTPARLTANSRFACVVSIFPVVRYAGVAEDKPDQFGEARFGANVVREDQDATLTGLDADHGVSGLAVMAALVESVTLRSVEEDDAQS